MSRGKWGESFLKTGVPLEHLTLMTLTSLGWECELHYEYRRPGSGDRQFEIDLLAQKHVDSCHGICLVVECKYHDQERFWFFLPSTSMNHLSGFSGGKLAPNDQGLFFVPLNPVVGENPDSILSLAPNSFWGTVVSQNGDKQDNAVYTALNQVAYAMAPVALEFFDAPVPTAILPVIVTSARLYRLRPEIVDLDVIRQAHSPSDIADELAWIWCHHFVDGELRVHNLLVAKKRFKEGLFSDMSDVDRQLKNLWVLPRWVAAINIDHLPEALKQISQYLGGLEKSDRRLDCIEVTERVWNHDFPQP